MGLGIGLARQFAHSPSSVSGRKRRGLWFRNWSEVRRWNAVFCCSLIRRSDAKECRLGKRPSEEHDPERKFCRNWPDQARTSRSCGIADSVEDVSGETGRDGECGKTVLSQQPPDRIGPPCQCWLD